MSLNPYSGDWNKETASHLLRRTSFAINDQQIQTAVSDGLDLTISKILEINNNVELPLNYYFEDDPEVPLGETWVNAGYQAISGLGRSRNFSFAGWIISQNLKNSISIQEKMTLFWHNHFPVADINDTRFLYRYYRLIRDNALGDFKQLVKDMTIDPSMLRYLNGNANTKNAPNENYARELLELFTIGKGVNVGDGDYTTFTEKDVQAIAKIMTGWGDVGHLNTTGDEVGVIFRPNRHDNTTKTLSHRFDNVEVPDGGDQEYKNLIDIVFQKDDVSKFIVRKFYRWFVHYNISIETETNVIEPLALIFRENDYQIAPVMEALLKSEHFYEADHIGCMIKNPMDYVLGTVGSFLLDTNLPDLAKKYTLWVGLYTGANILQMEMFNHPTVAGWKAYYQEPVYYRYWLNSVTLPIRDAVQKVLWNEGIKTANGATNFIKIDPFVILSKVSFPLDINVIVKEISDKIFVRPLVQNQLDYLKELVLQGLPDFEWTVEYADYLSEPDNMDKKLAIENKLRTLFLAMCQLPDYQLS